MSGFKGNDTGSPLAGIRTFPLITLFGALSGFLALEFGGWIIGSGFIAMAGLVTVAYLDLKVPDPLQGTQSSEKPGLTTEVAMLLMYTLGAYVANGNLGLAAAIGGTVAVLLHLKLQMHSLARRFGGPGFQSGHAVRAHHPGSAPILPQQAYGPFKVLNPFNIWLMVVLIVGISLAAYLIYKFVGERIGPDAPARSLAASSPAPATTVSFARQTKNSPDRSKPAAGHHARFCNCLSSGDHPDWRDLLRIFDG